MLPYKFKFKYRSNDHVYTAELKDGKYYVSQDDPRIVAYYSVTNAEYYINSGIWTIIPDKQFTKNDLKNGDICIKRNGSVEIAIVETGTFFCSNGLINCLSCIKDDLTSVFNNSYDIVKVVRATKPHHVSFDRGMYNQGVVVYERDPHLYITIKDIAEKFKVNEEDVYIIDKKI